MNVLQVEKLQVGYRKNVILKDINLTVAAAKITSIIGPNGCGKSTLLKTMGRIIKQRKGTVYLYGKDISRFPTLQIARHLAILPQHPSAPLDLTGEELVTFGRFPHQQKFGQLSPKDKEVIAWAMEVTKVISLCRHPLGSLSGGERQRFWLAMTLAQETEILLLDEPTTYLDIAQQLEMLKIIKQLNQEHHCTIVMVLHDINHAARFSHEIVAMKQGEIIAAGTPETMIRKEVLRNVFQIEARVIKDPLNGTPLCFDYDNAPIDYCSGGEAI